MKTRKMWPGLIVLAGLFLPQVLRAQNVFINIQAGQSSILNGQQGVLDVFVCNSDVTFPDGLTSPANTITPLVSFSTNLTILDVTRLDGTPLSTTDFDIIFISNNDSEGSHDVKVRIKKPLTPFGDCAEYRIKVQGNATGTAFVSGNLMFEVLPQLNNAADDNSSTTIPVLVNLPVTLKEFNANKVEKSAVLTWSTTEETNSDRFEVQRSANGRDWATIQTVQSGGESNSLRTYEAIDREPMNGDNLYRLKMVDKDGSTALSSVRSLEFEGVGMIVYPNPVVDFLHLSNGNWASVSNVTIYDVSGRKVYQSGAKPESTIDVRALRSGVYNVVTKEVNGAENSYRIVVAK